MRQHDWGVCECEPVFEGTPIKQIGWFLSMPLIQHPELVPEVCSTCKVRFKKEDEK